MTLPTIQQLWQSAKRSAELVFSVVLVLALAFVGYFGGHWLIPSESADEAVEGGQPPGAQAADGKYTTRISLSDLKTNNAQISLGRVQRRQLARLRTVPGVIQYDPARYLSLRSPLNCVVQKIRVKPGQHVEVGEVLAELSSPQVGEARNEVRRREAEQQLAAQTQQWASKTDSNLTLLLKFSETNPSSPAIETEFDDKVLGKYRQAIVAAYLKYDLAARVAARSGGSGQTVISGTILEKRINERAIARAEFISSCEASRFASRQDYAKAEAGLQAANRELSASRERLTLLLGPHGQSAQRETGSDFLLVAPLAGQIVEVKMTASARYQTGEQLLAIANTSQVWVAAQIQQQDRTALTQLKGTTLRVALPASPGTVFSAHVDHAGAIVSPTTLTVPLIASLTNTEELLRPGMFVWVDVPLESPRSAKAVPLSSIQRDDKAAFVFIQDSEGGYRAVQVVVLGEFGQWAEIESELSVGDAVVTAGAFILKSEMLLAEDES